MQTKNYLLFSSYVNADSPKTLQRMKEDILKCAITKMFADRLLEVFSTSRVVANSWRESYRLGRIGKQTLVYDFFVKVNIEGMKPEQVVALDSFWVGFLAGRESCGRNGSPVKVW